MTPDVENVKAYLKAAFCDVPLKFADGDGNLTERFLDMLNHLCACSEPFLTWRQAQVMALYFAERLSQEEIAERLGVNERTVRRDYSDALESVARRVNM